MRTLRLIKNIPNEISDIVGRNIMLILLIFISVINEAKSTDTKNQERIIKEFWFLKGFLLSAFLIEEPSLFMAEGNFSFEKKMTRSLNSPMQTKGRANKYINP